MKQIIVQIAGYARSGKDTIAQIICEQIPNSEILHFAYSLKQAADLAFLDLGIAGSEKEKLRPAWIGLGTAARNVDPDIFVKAMQSAIKASRSAVIVIPDWRYVNEALPGARRYVLFRDPQRFPPQGEEKKSIAEIVGMTEHTPLFVPDGLIALGAAAMKIVAEIRKELA